MTPQVLPRNGVTKHSVYGSPQPRKQIFFSCKKTTNLPKTVHAVEGPSKLQRHRAYPSQKTLCFIKNQTQRKHQIPVHIYGGDSEAHKVQGLFTLEVVRDSVSPSPFPSEEP